MSNNVLDKWTRAHTHTRTHTIARITHPLARERTHALNRLKNHPGPELEGGFASGCGMPIRETRALNGGGYGGIMKNHRLEAARTAGVYASADNSWRRVPSPALHAAAIDGPVHALTSPESRAVAALAAHSTDSHWQADPTKRCVYHSDPACDPLLSFIPPKEACPCSDTISEQRAVSQLRHGPNNICFSGRATPTSCLVILERFRPTAAACYSL